MDRKRGWVPVREASSTATVVPVERLRPWAENHLGAFIGSLLIGAPRPRRFGFYEGVLIVFRLALGALRMRRIRLRPRHLWTALWAA